MINAIKKRGSSKGFYSVPCTPSQSNLSVTPASMLFDAEHGIPIKSQVDDSKFYDGDETSSMYLDPVLTRGYDINDAWSDGLDAKKKFIAAHNNDVNIYGNGPQ